MTLLSKQIKRNIKNKRYKIPIYYTTKVHVLIKFKDYPRKKLDYKILKKGFKRPKGGMGSKNSLNPVLLKVSFLLILKYL